MDEPELAIAASPREWALRLHRHVTDHGGARVRVTALQAADVLEEFVDVLVADDTTSFLTPRLVELLHGRGGKLLGVFDEDEPRGKGELLDLGADEVLSRDAEPAAFLAAIGVLARTLPRQSLTEDGEGPGRPAPADEPRGAVTAVASTLGGAGATEVALALAAAAARQGQPVVLVDADEIGPAVAQRLGLPLYPNLRAAVDIIEQGRGCIADALSSTLDGRLAVLVGLAAGRDWPQIRPVELLGVLDELRGRYAQVIVNVGPLIEDLTAQGLAPRFGQTRAVLATASSIVAVGLPTPVGVTRLLEWASDIRALASTTPLHVVFNRTPGGAFRRGEVEQEVRRSLSPASLTFVPQDPRVPQAAWQGGLVAEGPFARTVAGTAVSALPVIAGPARVRPSCWRRRSVR